MVNDISIEDRAVLEHVVRYRLTLPNILAATEILAEEGESSALSALRRLTQEGWLAAADLFPGYRADSYYHISEKGAQFLGHDPVIAQPLKHDPRAEAFAIATFCCCQEPRHELLTKEEFKRKLAHLWFTGQPIRHYLDKGADGVIRLVYLKVDTAGAGRWDRLIDSCDRFLQQRMDKTRVRPEHRPKAEEYSKLVDEGRFKIAVLTAFPEKQRAIELELARRKQSGEQVPPIHVHVVPGLFEVLYPAPAP